MCAGAISLARVARLVFAADDPKGGAVLHGPRFFEQPTCHHRPVVARAGDAAAAGAMLKEFFRVRRNLTLRSGPSTASSRLRFQLRRIEG